METHTNREVVLEGVDLINDTLKPWGLDLMQLQKGCFTTHLQQTHIAEHTLQRIAFDKHIWQRGIAPADCLNIGVILSNSGNMSLNNKTINFNTIELFSPEDEFDVVSPAGFDGYTFALHKNLIEIIMTQCEMKLDFDLLISKHRVFSCDSVNLIKIKLMLNTMLSPDFQNSNQFCQTQSLFDVSDTILQQLDNSEASIHQISTHTKNRIITRAFAFISENLYQPFNLGDLCTAVHTSLRTLSRCFQEKFNMSPKRMITLFRLHSFRKLIVQMPNQKIYVLAKQCGFWHMGKLGVDYKELFGELPSHTRRGS